MIELERYKVNDKFLRNFITQQNSKIENCIYNISLILQDHQGLIPYNIANFIVKDLSISALMELDIKGIPTTCYYPSELLPPEILTTRVPDFVYECYIGLKTKASTHVSLDISKDSCFMYIGNSIQVRNMSNYVYVYLYALYRKLLENYKETVILYKDEIYPLYNTVSYILCSQESLLEGSNPEYINIFTTIKSVLMELIYFSNTSSINEKKKVLYRNHLVKSHESIESIVLSEMGSMEYIEDIISLNNLVYPYVSSKYYSDNVAYPGFYMKIPIIEEEEVIFEDTRVLLSDIKLEYSKDALSNKRGRNIVSTYEGDIEVTNGIELVKQCVLNRLMTQRDELLFHPEYFSDMISFIGENIYEITSQKASSEFTRVCLSEPLVNSVEDVKCTARGSIIYIGGTIKSIYGSFYIEIDNVGI